MKQEENAGYFQVDFDFLKKHPKWPSPTDNQNSIEIIGDIVRQGGGLVKSWEKWICVTGDTMIYPANEIPSDDNTVIILEAALVPFS